MAATSQAFRKRLQYILHWGFTEVRNLAYGGQSEQIADLADAMEILPRYLDACSDENLDLIRFVLQNCLSKYPQSTSRYMEILEGQRESPERY